MRINRGLDSLAGTFCFQLHDGGFAGSGDALVRADHAALDAVGVVQWLEGHHELHCCAIGVGDDAVIGTNGIAVHLGHHQRTSGIHAPGTAVIDDRGPRLGKLRRPLFGYTTARTEQRHLRPCSQYLLHGMYGPFPALKPHLTPGAAFTAGGKQFLHWQRQFLHHFKHGPPDESRRSNYRQFQSFHGS